MVIELPEKLEAALKAEASAHGVSTDRYALEILERGLAPAVEPAKPVRPLKTGYGSLAAYGPAPSFEEFQEARREMFRNFGKDF